MYRKQGLLDGNLVRSLFRNDGEIGDWLEGAVLTNSGEWPKGSHRSYIDGCTPIVTTRIVAPGNGNVVHPVATAYREEVDIDPVTGAKWMNQPVPGYVAPTSEIPAISSKPVSWPITWPKALNIGNEWDGYWYGYFGRGVENADQETFFVMDDSQDKEFSRVPYSYFPQVSNPERGGLGLRVEVRGFQWINVLAEDIIFWHYDIINLSDGDYDSTYFGFYCDTGVGGANDSDGDYASYDTKLDIAYAYDDPPVGGPASARFKTGYVGYAFLESPGNSFNGIDDDQDGLVDETRSNGIDDDGDWIGFTDLNGNGVWDFSAKEPLNHDVGKDGVGPLDVLLYKGPDEGEGDGRPTDGEPNFDKTDKDESDQIGLTSLAIERLSNKGVTAIWPKNDEVIYNKMVAGTFDTTIQNTNIQILFGSGPFPLKKFLRERFSVALVFGEDFDDMVFNKETVQQIYNANYNFSKPPYKPTLTAIPGDEKVFLFWDGIAEESVDPFLGYKKDFEGYLILRSQEPEFQDVKIITDSKGSAKYSKPIAQFDLKNGIKGPDPVGVNGAHFWRGDDSGLQHSFVDTNVVNGQTYYYACVAYDQGDPNYGSSGLIPTETTKTISVDQAGTITFIDINCAVVVPNAPAAGYQPSQIIGDLTGVTEGTGTGYLSATVLNDADVLDGANYKVNFISSVDPVSYRTTNYFVTKEVNGIIDTLTEVGADSSTFGAGVLSTPFDGLAFSVVNYDSLMVNLDKTGWIKGFSNYDLHVVPDTGAIKSNSDKRYPADYQLEFVPMGSVTTTYTKMPINFVAKNITRGEAVEVELFDLNKTKTLDIGDVILLLEKVNNKLIYAWKISYNGPINSPFAAPPVAGDIFRLSVNKPFRTGDYFSFSTKSASVNDEDAKDNLDKINVVPNPYVVTNLWEKRTIAESGRGDRRIDFTNLPAKCTVRIYTITGALIKTLYKDSSPTDGSISWNLVTEDGMDIAYGIYVYHVDAKGIGEKIGKFAVIK